MQGDNARRRYQTRCPRDSKQPRGSQRGHRFPALEDHHFTFLGYRELNYVGNGKRTYMEIVDGSGLGALRKPGNQHIRWFTRTWQTSKGDKRFADQSLTCC